MNLPDQRTFRNLHRELSASESFYSWRSKTDFSINRFLAMEKKQYYASREVSFELPKAVRRVLGASLFLAQTHT